MLIIFKMILNLNRISERRQKRLPNKYILINVSYIFLTNIKRNKRQLYNIFMEIWTPNFFSLEASESYSSFNKTTLLLHQHFFFLIIAWIQSSLSNFSWSLLDPSCPLTEYCFISQNCSTLPFQTLWTWKVSTKGQSPPLIQLFPGLSYSAEPLAPRQ